MSGVAGGTRACVPSTEEGHSEPFRNCAPQDSPVTRNGNLSAGNHVRNVMRCAESTHLRVRHGALGPAAMRTGQRDRSADSVWF